MHYEILRATCSSVAIYGVEFSIQWGMQKEILAACEVIFLALNSAHIDLIRKTKNHKEKDYSIQKKCKLKNHEKRIAI